MNKQCPIFIPAWEHFYRLRCIFRILTIKTLIFAFLRFIPWHFKKQILPMGVDLVSIREWITVLKIYGKFNQINSVLFRMHMH